MSHTQGLFYDGAWHMGRGALLQSFNPATGALVWEGLSAHVDDVDAAVASAKKAFLGWSRMSFDARLEIIQAFRTKVDASKAILSHMIAKETGKPLWDCEGEVTAVLGKIDHSVRAYHERTGERRVAGDIPHMLQHRPHGVMAVLGPYNFPAHLPNGHIVPALLAGNVVVFKPSEETPRVAEWMVSCWQEAGLPDGVLNLVQGGRVTGEALVRHKDLAGVLFTGSYGTGKALHHALAGRVDVLLALEMGGNNPLIVWDVADAVAAATLIVQSAFITSGQRCTCARRLIVPADERGDVILDALLARMDTIRVGGAFDVPAPFMGSLIHNRIADELLKMQEWYAAAGAKLLRPMKRLQPDLPFLTAGLADVTRKSNVPDVEFFGPFLQVKRVKDWEGALFEANQTAYGLAAGLLSDRRDLWEQFVREVRAGVVNWNRPTTGANSGLPFGGVGLSGNHRPSAFYAADYCAYPVASLLSETVTAPEQVVGLENLR